VERPGAALRFCGLKQPDRGMNRTRRRRQPDPVPCDANETSLSLEHDCGFREDGSSSSLPIGSQPA
jgi:hypothetical protein